MKISEHTIEILKNYSMINQSIWVKAHEKKLKTISIAKNILSVAKIDEDFPVDFGIYSLVEFLNVLTLFESPDIEFKDKYAVIKGDRSSVKYYYASSDVIVKPEKEISISDPDVTVQISSSDLSRVMKASSVLVLPNISVIGRGGKIFLTAHHLENPSSNTYEVEIGETDDVVDFSMDFLAENLKMIPADYTVDLYAKGISHFKKDGDDELQYWIALQPSSSYDA